LLVSILGTWQKRNLEAVRALAAFQNGGKLLLTQPPASSTHGHSQATILAVFRIKLVIFGTLIAQTSRPKNKTRVHSALTAPARHSFADHHAGCNIEAIAQAHVISGRPLPPCRPAPSRDGIKSANDRWRRSTTRHPRRLISSRASIFIAMLCVCIWNCATMSVVEAV
jgi:hypothetical protein